MGARIFLKNVRGGGKRTRERTLPKIFGPLQTSFWSALSKTDRALRPEGGWKTYRTRGGGSKTPFWEGCHREVFHPPLFSIAPCRPLISSLVVCSFCAEALFCSLLCSFAPFCAPLQTCVCSLFALICALLRVSSSDWV